MTDTTPEITALAAAAKPDDLNALSKCGLHEQTRKALEAMAHEGISLRDAAKRFDIRPDNLSRAHDRPKVRKAFMSVRRAIRVNAAADAHTRIEYMSRHADSERVRFDANRWVAGVDGVSPVQRVDARHQHNVQFQGFVYPDIHAKDVSPEDGE